MLISELAKKSNTTKKAVQCYVEQGLIIPKILENGYKDFSEQDEELLKQIVLYRKLGLSISDIKCLLENSGEITKILYKRTLELECEKMRQEILKKLEAGETVEHFEKEINNINSNAIIINRLMELFPNYYGKFISICFSRYLTGKIETKEQMQAFNQIVEFFDNVPTIVFPEDLQQYLDKYPFEEDIQKINHILDKRDNAFKNIEEFVNNNREILDEYNKYKQSEEYKNSSAFRLMEYMKQICSANGYYDVFIPAIRKLSPLYDEYYEQMLEANEKFIKNYPEYLN